MSLVRTHRPPARDLSRSGCSAHLGATAAFSWRSVDGGTTALGARADPVLATASCVWLLAVCHVQSQGASRPARETAPPPAVVLWCAHPRACVRVGLERTRVRGGRAGVRPVSQRRTRRGRQRRRARRGSAKHAPTRHVPRRNAADAAGRAAARPRQAAGGGGRRPPLGACAQPTLFPVGRRGEFPEGLRGSGGQGEGGPQGCRPRVEGVLRRLGGRGRGLRR